MQTLVTDYTQACVGGKMCRSNVEMPSTIRFCTTTTITQHEARYQGAGHVIRQPFVDLLVTTDCSRDIRAKTTYAEGDGMDG
jgi:hypothetical protein